MTSMFEVSIESPQSGWVSVRLRAGEESLVMCASHAPSDSLLGLIEGLSALLEGSDYLTVRWNCEPEEFDFSFAAAGDSVQLTVIRHPDHRRAPGTGHEVYKAQSSMLDLCTAFWRELRDLQRRAETDVYEQNWRRPFPQDEMRNLTRLIRTARHGRKAGAARRTVQNRAPA